MMNGVLMDIMKSSQIARLVGEMSFPEILPKPSSADNSLPAIEFFGSEAVEFSNTFAERFCTVRALRDVRDEMVVVC